MRRTFPFVKSTFFVRLKLTIFLHRRRSQSPVIMLRDIEITDIETE